MIGANAASLQPLHCDYSASEPPSALCRIVRKLKLGMPYYDHFVRYGSGVHSQVGS